MEGIKEMAGKTAVLNSNPLAYEQKLLVNKRCKTLEELRQTFTPATCSVLSQVRDFLPKLATANEDLQKRLASEPACSFDIEHIESDQPHIEMDLALFEDTSDEATTTDDSEDDCDPGDIEVNENNIKLMKNTQKPSVPVIEVLSETNNGKDSSAEVNSDRDGSSSLNM